MWGELLSLWEKALEVLQIEIDPYIVEAEKMERLMLMTAARNDTKKDQQIEHLERSRAYVREELMLRMKQRDSYAIQMMIAFGGLIGLYYAFEHSSISIPLVLIAAPLISIYFTKLIMYSYNVSNHLGRFMREKIEHRLAILTGFTEDVVEWEQYRKKHLAEITGGVRRWFFLLVNLTICVLIALYSYQVLKDSGNIDITRRYVNLSLSDFEHYPYWLGFLYIFCLPFLFRSEWYEEINKYVLSRNKQESLHDLNNLLKHFNKLIKGWEIEPTDKENKKKYDDFIFAFKKLYEDAEKIDTSNSVNQNY